ncbi:glycosyltransferase [Cellulomonas taurus]|uniref:glycosyltransferase n=1 Tax=Cellulomonas taurus TaxID=2729175 RepID=UPI00145C6655|nr:glycosyltransferase [Cellulomonas taurus]
MTPLRICVIAPLRFPIRRPHAGGLESAVWNEVRALRARGHQVSLIGVEGSDFLDDGPPEFVLPSLSWPTGTRPTDSTYPPGYLTRSVPALDRALDLVRGRFDVLSNHCLHGLPLRRSAELGVPMVSTLHTPLDPELVDALPGAGSVRFLAVSEHTREQWTRVGVDATVLPNGIAADDWPLGPGGDGLVWFGRIVPEKAPHVAIAVARALGMPLTLAGRIGDQEYADREVLPHVDGTSVRYAGLLDQSALAALIGSSACALGTPAWAEPFGLVGPEALMCGTPVATFGVGGIVEIARRATGMIAAPPGDLGALAEATRRLTRRSTPEFRAAIRATARRHWSLDARTDTLERVFGELAGRPVELLA